MRKCVIYSTNQAEGAIPNGTVIEKVGSEGGDAHKDGARGRVLGSIGPSKVPGYDDVYAYFVVWDDMPGVPVGVRELRIRVADYRDLL